MALTQALQNRRNALISEASRLPFGPERTAKLKMTLAFNARILQTIGAAVRTPSQALSLR